MARELTVGKKIDVWQRERFWRGTLTLKGTCIFDGMKPAMSPKRELNFGTVNGSGLAPADRKELAFVVFVYSSIIGDI